MTKKTWRKITILDDEEKETMSYALDNKGKLISFCTRQKKISNFQKMINNNIPFEPFQTNSRLKLSNNVIIFSREQTIFTTPPTENLIDDQEIISFEPITMNLEDDIFTIPAFPQSDFMSDDEPYF